MLLGTWSSDVTPAIDCVVKPILTILAIATLLSYSICSSMSEHVKQMMRDCLAAVSQDPSVGGMIFQARYTNAL